MEKFITILLSVLITISMFFLLRLIFHEYDRLIFTSIPRLIVFAVIHLYVVCLLTCVFFIQQTYSLGKWVFFLTLPPAIAMTLVQGYIYANYTSQLKLNFLIPEPLQLGYLNCYFMIFMYSLIGSLLSGLFLCLTNILAYYQFKKIQKAITKCVKQMPFSLELYEVACAICLTEFQEKDNLILKISCGHIFHGECLIGWLRVNQTCPNCRYDIFSGLDEQERADIDYRQIL